jgi:hypothetical protein
MANYTTVRYNLLGVAVGPSPSTGFQFNTGFNDVYTGANSGTNLISYLQRVQTVSNGLQVDREFVYQIGGLSYLDQVILNQPQVPITVNWISADASNEAKIGLYCSGDSAALTNILNTTQNERNLFLALAPEGVDLIGWTGQSKVFQLNNSYFDSYSAEASVGGFATASATFQGLNYSTSTGSINQDLNAVNPTNGAIVPGLKFTLPVMTTGRVGSVSALRFGDIQVDVLSGVQGFVASDLKIQSYSLNFSTNLQNLQKLGSPFSYAKIPQFPVLLNASFTANYGDITTGTLSNLLCNDPLYNLKIRLYQPGCGGNGPLALQYDLRGVKLQGQDQAAQDVGSNAATVTFNYVGSIGGSNDSNINLFISGLT